jgi:GntR family transcriptional regulator, transcriptional repressor for pyruvate dehydrogenase complex
MVVQQATEQRTLIRRQTLTSQVVDYVVNLIKSGKVRPGQKLPTESQLVESLGVSRTCVREAMKSLESLRIVRIRPRVGATVLEPSPADLLHAEHFSIAMQKQQTDVLLEFRMIMEVGLASLAAEKRTEADLNAMSEALEKYRRELDSNQVDCITDMAFHSTLAYAAKNPIAVMVWQMLSSRLSEILRRTIVLPSVPEQSYRDHVKIFRAIKQGSARKAGHAMRAHLEDADRIWRLALQPLKQHEQDQSQGSYGDSEIPGRPDSLPEQPHADGSHEP